LTFWGNQIEFVVLLIAHPIVRGALLLSVEDKDVAEEADADGVDDVRDTKLRHFLFEALHQPMRISLPNLSSLYHTSFNSALG
jgi:hypothetical protein